MKTHRLLLTAALLAASCQAAAEHTVTLLTAADFRYGSYIIDRPGIYRLAENISFNPNSPATLTAALAEGTIPPASAARLGLPDPVDAWHAGFPLPTQFAPGGVANFTPGGPLDSRYDPAAFGLGFFAAIVIKADNVVLDLAGHTIEQSAEHALLQRFFAVIELAEQPFVPGQGPADFGQELVAARNVVIRNGTIGRSAHHGIHGNGNARVRIVDVDFVDYEVAAVALNGVQGLMIRNVTATNRKDVPVLGTFSAAQFIKPYLAALRRGGAATTLSVGGTGLDIEAISSALRDAVNAVHHDIIVAGAAGAERAVIDSDRHPEEYALFHNRHGVVDGNSYSFLVNQLGVAVNGFPRHPAAGGRPARNVWLSNVRVFNQQGFVNEVVALRAGGSAAVDPAGAVFQVFNVHPDSGEPVTVSSLNPALARYRGNVLANAQALVAKAQLAGAFAGSGLDLSRLSVDAAVIDWVEARPGFETLDRIAPGESAYFCNGDSMFHVNKGVIAFRMDAARNLVLRNTVADGVENLGREGSAICGDYSRLTSHPQATLPGYGGARTRGYTFAGSRNVLLAGARATGLVARAGSAIGIDILTDSARALLRGARVSDVRAGLDGPVLYAGPNETPTAQGIRIGSDARHIAVHSACAEMLLAFGDEAVIFDQSEMALLRRVCR